jgi:hypothetical protein
MLFLDIKIKYLTLHYDNDDILNIYIKMTNNEL